MSFWFFHSKKCRDIVARQITVKKYRAPKDETEISNTLMAHNASTTRERFLHNTPIRDVEEPVSYLS